MPRYARNRSLPSLVLGLLVLLAGSSPCLAQGDDDEEYEKPPAFANLGLHFDKSGAVDADLMLDKPPADWQSIREALAQSLHCPADSFNNPGPSSYEADWLRKMPAARRATLEKSFAASRLRQLHGHCGNALSSDGWIVRGEIPLQPLALALLHEGKQSLMLSVRRPVAPLDEHPPAQSQPWLARNDYLAYTFPLTGSNAVGDFHLAYGFRRTDLIRISAISLGFLLLPLLITLWMRRAALRDASEDPTAAWFSYFKTLQWCVNSTMLLWMVAHTSIRQGLEDLISFRLGDNSWQAPLARTAITIIPPWLVYLLCLSFSYEVFLRVRGNRWKRHEFLLNQFFTLGAQFLPLMFFLSAFDFLHAAPKLMVLLFAAAYFSRIICARGAAKISGSAPEALTTGELRDRIFDLARRTGVQIKHLFVLSAGKSQIANAFAAKNNIVIFTDYLLRRLTKREVDAIAGHELSHLRLGHPKKLGFTVIMAVLFPMIFRGLWTVFSSMVIGAIGTLADPSDPLLDNWTRAVMGIAQWQQLDLVLITTGFAFFYYQARRFERAADEGSIHLVGDPEALITGLLKISRLNLMPIQWGKVTGSMLTHPSTLKRVEHIAEIGNISQDRLQAILAHHWEEQQAWRASLQQETAPSSGEHYSVPESAGRVLTTSAVARRATNHLWILISAHVLPPALVVLLVQNLGLRGWPETAAYIAGAPASIAFYAWLTVSLGLRGRKQLHDAFRRKFGQEGIALTAQNALLTGFSPGPNVRFYLSSYNWDTGFCLFLRDRIVFIGDKVRFALKHEQIVAIRLGPGGPGWWNGGRLYLDWRDAEKSRQGTFSLLPQEPASITKIKREATGLQQRLIAWQQNPSAFPEVQASLLTLESPALGEVTSQSPKQVLAGAKANTISLMIFLVGYGVSTLLNISPWYSFAVILLIRIYERIPYWRYRETPVRAMELTQQLARAQANRGT